MSLISSPAKSSLIPTYDIKLFGKEVNLIKRLRKFDYGVMEVHKLQGDLIRTIAKKNKLLVDDLEEPI